MFGKKKQKLATIVELNTPDPLQEFKDLEHDSTSEQSSDY